MASRPTSNFSSKPVVVFLSLIAMFYWTSPAMSLPVNSDYLQRRADMIKLDKSTGMGSKLVLSAQEKIVSEYLVKEKTKMIEAARLGMDVYTPALSFFHSKPLIEKSPIYKLIKKMPKGAALHLHDIATASLDWVVKNVTYRDNLYMCVDEMSYFMKFKFMPKAVPNPGCEWKSVKDERAKSASQDQFDESIKRNISLLSTDPLTTFKDVNDVWVRFNMYFLQVYDMLMSTITMGDYFSQALKEFYDDNVQYIELRTQMWGLADLDGTKHDAEYGLNILRNATKDFMKCHPDFGGAKFIMSGIRAKPRQAIFDEVKVAMDLHQRYADDLLGYDLVGQEAPNNPLLFYLNDLLYPSQQNPPVDLPYFFHAAETNWQDNAVDYNLVDAVLLNTTRIGHGYGLPKHPAIIDIAKKDGIAVEVNPISNQLLGLVSDLRNHAMVPLMTDDFPVVISSDDPSTWEAAPLSHDFFMAFTDMVGQDSGLEALKQMAINSIQYSALNGPEKQKLMTLWQRKWDLFVKESVQFITNDDAVIG